MDYSACPDFSKQKNTQHNANAKYRQVCIRFCPFLSYHIIPRVLDHLGTLHTKPLLNIFVAGLLIHEAVSLYFIGRSHQCLHGLYVLEMETIFLAMGRLILHLKRINAIDVWFTCKFFQIICCDYVAPTTSNKLMRLCNIFPTVFGTQ